MDKLNILVTDYMDSEYEAYLKELAKEVNIIKYSDYSTQIDAFIKQESKNRYGFVGSQLFLDLMKKNEIMPEIPNILFFTGGSDVNPKLYGESKGKQTVINKDRDILEKNMYENFRKLPKLGICRGAQFLTVMNGGKLIQHVEGHNGIHPIKVDYRGDIYTYNMTSSHHQMMYPYSTGNYEIIGWAKTYLSNVYLNGKDEQINIPEEFLEPEIVVYNNRYWNELCIQGHPEWGSCPKNTRNFTQSLIRNYLLNNDKINNIKKEHLIYYDDNF